MKAITLIVSSLLLVVHGNALAMRPLAVSPGTDKGLAVIGESCPTFSWSSSETAVAYRIEVFYSLLGEVMSWEEMAVYAEPILQREIPAPALSWTPDSGQCLEMGESYIWFVQAIDTEGQGTWSDGKLFETDISASLAVSEDVVKNIVKNYLASEAITNDIIQNIAASINEYQANNQANRAIQATPNLSQHKTSAYDHNQLQQPLADDSGGPSVEADYFSGAMVLDGSENVGIGTDTPDARLDVYGVRYIGVSSDCIVNVGTSSSYHVTLDQNEIHARNGANPSNLYINDFGGNVAIARNGNVGIGKLAGSARLEVQGDAMVTNTMYIQNAGYNSEALTVRGNILVQRAADGSSAVEIGEGLDYAEGFDVSGPKSIDAGTVLSIDPAHPGKLKVCDRAYDTRVAGIVAGAQGLGSGVRLGVDQFDYDVALAGRVYCNVDATYGPVSPGDLLTTSPTPGYAMVVKNYHEAQGAIIGKAMESLATDNQGQILVLVTLQ